MNSKKIKKDIPCIADFVWKRDLGRGGFGEVKEMQKISSGEDYLKLFAIKRLEISKTKKEDILNEESVI